MHASSVDQSANTNSYVDPWQEYKAISNKLKKRFLRKPNVGEASRELQNLAVRCAEEECPQYAAMCKLSAARCEHQLNNVAQECFHLKEAARLFMNCELERKQYNSPSFYYNLNSAIHCYGHAIKSLAERKFFQQAGHVCLELGQNLLNLDRPYESVEYFEKAFKFYKNHPLDELHALRMNILARILNNEHRNALNVLEKSKNLVESRFLPKNDDAEKSTSLPKFTRSSISPKSNLNLNNFLKRYLRDVEILRILLIVAVSPNVAQRLTADESALRILYVGHVTGDQSDSSGEKSKECDSRPIRIDDASSDNLDEDEFLLLRSFVMALCDKDFSAADVCLTDLRPYLSHIQLDLAINVFDLLKQINTMF